MQQQLIELAGHDAQDFPYKRPVAFLQIPVAGDAVVDGIEHPVIAPILLFFTQKRPHAIQLRHGLEQHAVLRANRLPETRIRGIQRCIASLQQRGVVGKIRSERQEFHVQFVCICREFARLGAMRFILRPFRFGVPGNEVEGIVSINKVQSIPQRAAYLFFIAYGHTRVAHG